MLSILLISYLSQVLSYQYIPYQAHGFNDLDYLNYSIQGVDYFKLDISPQIEDQCEQYSNWQNWMNPCEVYKSGFEICCLAVRGDTSSLPIFNQAFNNSNDIVNLLRDPTYNYLFNKNSKYPYNKRKNLQVNFQFVDSQSNITSDFLYQLLKTIEELDLNIDFMSGSRDIFWAIYRQCMWRNCTDQQLYITEAPVNLLFSDHNAPEEFWHKHITGINIYYGHLQQFCENGFPEWFQQYGFPLVFWEPSHEFQVQQTRIWYTDPKCKLPEKYKPIEMLRIASNLEPEMLQVYWKQTVFELNNTFDSNDQKVVMYGDFYNVSIEYSSYCDYMVIAFNHRINQTGSVQIYDEDFNIVQSFQINFEIMTLRVQADYILVSGFIQVILFKLTNETRSCLYDQTIEFPLTYDIIQLSINSQELVAFKHNNNYTVTLYFLNIDTLLVNGYLTYDLGAVLRSPTLNLMFDVYFQNTSQTYQLGITFTKYGQLIGEQGGFQQIYNILIKLTNQTKIYLALLHISKKYKVLEYVPAVHHVDFGTTNDLKLHEINGTMFLLAIHTNGLCQSAILLNNNQWNKCLYDNYEQYEAISNVKYMINYIWGRLDDIKQRVLTGTRINGCDKQIMHAKVGNGGGPSVTLKQSNGTYQAFVISEFIHYDKQPSFSKLFCGSSNDYNKSLTSGMLLFSFDLLHPNEFKRMPR